jgi:Cu/Zn superoxide dismutase
MNCKKFVLKPGNIWLGITAKRSLAVALLAGPAAWWNFTWPAFTTFARRAPATSTSAHIHQFPECANCTQKKKADL